MAKRSKRRRGNPDFRHRVPGPLPAVAEIEAELTALLTPALFAPRHLERRDPRNPDRLIRVRARILTLPVMVALVVSLVWRRLGSTAEVPRVIVQDGLLWISPLQVSEQAIAKRLDTMPASALAAVFTEVSARVQAQPPPSPARPLHSRAVATTEYRSLPERRSRAASRGVKTLPLKGSPVEGSNWGTPPEPASLGPQRPVGDCPPTHLTTTAEVHPACRLNACAVWKSHPMSRVRSIHHFVTSAGVSPASDNQQM